MCVCAGTTGAAIVPVAHKARAAMRPHHAVHQRASAPAMAAPCLDVPALPAIAALPEVGTVPALADAMAAPQSPWSTARGGRAGFAGGAASLGGGGGGGSAPTPTVLPPAPTPGAVPEPVSWAMMITGFGVVGSVLRWQRREVA